MQGNRHIQTREIDSFSSSSVLANPAASERSPLLTSRGGILRTSSKSHSGTVSEYRFDWKREKLRCRRMFYNRIPRGKAAFVVFLLNFLESFAFYGALGLIRFVLFENHGRYKNKHGDTEGRSPDSDFLFTVMFFTAGRVFYPVAGLIADVYLGRYRVIHIGLWLFWVGYAIILMSMALEWQYEHLSLLRKAPAIIATILFMLGSASVESPIIPYGVDQIRQGAPSDELSSYFFWYYFGRNAGFVFNVVCSIVVATLLRASNYDMGISEFTNTTIAPIRNMEHTIIHSIVGVIALVGITVALLLHFCLKHWFFKARRQENPLKSILNVVFFAATVRRQAPRYRRSFRYGEGRKSRIELAKVEFDGIYSSEEVEDVKTFLRMLFLVLSLGFSFVTYGALSSIYAYITAMYSKANISTLVDDGVVLLFIPFLNHIILPCIPSASMKRRIGVGVFFLLLSTAMATIVQWQLENISPHHMKLIWQVMPIVLFAVAEALIFISGLEFIYAQSPDSMKGLLIGLFYFIFGAFSAVGTTIFKYYADSMWFYYTVLMVCGLGLLLYMLVVFCYRNRERPTNDESEKEILHRSFATSVYLS